MGLNLPICIVLLIGCEVVGGLQLQFRFINNYIYQTTLQVGNNNNLTVLLDLTGTEFWLFGSKNATNSSILLSANQTQGNQSLTNLTYSTQNGLYDHNFNVSAWPSSFDGNITLSGNVTIRGPVKFGVVNAEDYNKLRSEDTILGAGILGWGRNQSSNLTNYLSSLLNVTVGRFVLCTRPPYSQAVLIINEDYFNASIIANATTTPINQQNQIKPGAFEFNVTSVKIGSGYYVESTMPATVSTLSNYLSVDPRTWQYIEYKFKPVYDPKTLNYLVNCWHQRRLRLEFNVQQPKNSTVRPLMVPGSDLVAQTKTGYCVLKIRPNKDNLWVLGGPFLRHHCIQFDLAKQQITFVNNSIFYPWKKHIYG